MKYNFVSYLIQFPGLLSKSYYLMPETLNPFLNLSNSDTR